MIGNQFLEVPLDNKIYVKGYTADENFDGTIIIPGGIDGYPVAIYGDAFSDDNLLKKVIIQCDNVSAGAFYNCSNLETVIFSNTSKINANAFAYCTNLQDVFIPQNSKVYAGAFYGCEKLTSIAIGNNASFYGDVFGESGLKDVYIDTNSTYSVNSYYEDAADKKLTEGVENGEVKKHYYDNPSKINIKNYGTWDNGKNLLIGYDDKYQLELEDISFCHEGIKWYSDNPDIADVTEDGLVIPKGEGINGSTYIRCISLDGSLQDACRIYATGLQKAKFCVGYNANKVGGFTPVNVFVNGNGIVYTAVNHSLWGRATNVTGMYYTCTSSDNNVVSVVKSSPLEFKAVNEGVATVTYTSSNTGFKASITVNVMENGGETGNGFWFAKDNQILFLADFGTPHSSAQERLIAKKQLRLGDYETTAEIPWYSKRLNIEEIKIEEGITYIGTKTFYNCINAKEIEIPATVTEIADDAFTNCDEIVIYGNSNSYAKTYADSHNIPFISTDIDDSETEQPTVPEEPKESLKEMSVDFTQNSVKYYFDVNIEDVSEECLVYAGIYDENDKLLNVATQPLEASDLTTVSLPIMSETKYAKIFIWKLDNMKPISNHSLVNIN